MAMLRVSLANDVREVRRIHHALSDFLAEEGVPGRTIHHVRLVVEELVVNVVRYAYPDKSAHLIGVDVRTEPRRVVVTIEDDGRPFNPNTAPPIALRESMEARRGGGLGIHLVKKLSRELTYARENERNRVRATIDFAAQ
ncbi:MAG TPA: ATP-binding protein [Candidatus Krumholzibacteria bacterium]|nr:ATP-binding protein [Candidatus Krumholzibacteria bacterium]